MTRDALQEAQTIFLPNRSYLADIRPNSPYVSEVSVAMQSKVGLGSLAGVIHPYPTRAESVRQAGDLYNKTKLTPVVRSLFRNLMAIKR